MTREMDDLMLLKPGGIVPVDMETTGKLVNMLRRLQEENERLREYAKKAVEAERERLLSYDKTDMNGFVSDLYDEKTREGKHGHYETVFHVVHCAIKRVASD